MDNRIDLAKYFAKLGFKKGAEIGVLKGSYSEVLFREIPGLELYGIDSWGLHEVKRAEYHLRMWEKAKKRLAKNRVHLIRKLSMDAVTDFEYGYFDFVYIDANHKFDYVIEDVIEWSRRVKPGGIVSGDDYVKTNPNSVFDAVNIYAKVHDIRLNVLNDGTWWFIKQ